MAEAVCVGGPDPRAGRGSALAAMAARGGWREGRRVVPGGGVLFAGRIANLELGSRHGLTRYAFVIRGAVSFAAECEKAETAERSDVMASGERFARAYSVTVRTAGPGRRRRLD